MKSYIQKVHGFREENIQVLLDDGKHTEPTRKNILKAYSELVRQCQPWDAVLCHYAGTFLPQHRLLQYFYGETKKQTTYLVASCSLLQFQFAHTLAWNKPFLIGHGGSVPDTSGDEGRNKD